MIDQEWFVWMLVIGTIILVIMFVASQVINVRLEHHQVELLETNNELELDNERLSGNNLALRVKVGEVVKQLDAEKDANQALSVDAEVFFKAAGYGYGITGMTLDSMMSWMDDASMTSDKARLWMLEGCREGFEDHRIEAESAKIRSPKKKKEE